MAVVIIIKTQKCMCGKVKVSSEFAISIIKVAQFPSTDTSILRATIYLK